MSPMALQHLVLRMHYDPALVARVYAGEPVPGLDDEGRAWLQRVDRRAWAVDPYRRARTLTALVEEYPVSAAEAGMAGLDAFFSSPAFIAMLTERGSLADAFGVWIRGRAGAVAELERAIARARRIEDIPLEPGQIVARAVSVELPEGTLARWEAVRVALGPDPTAKLAAGFRSPARPRASREPEYVLVQGESAAVGSEGVHALVEAARVPVAAETVLQVGIRLGLEREEAVEIVDDLVADGVFGRG